MSIFVTVRLAFKHVRAHTTPKNTHAGRSKLRRTNCQHLTERGRTRPTPTRRRHIFALNGQPYLKSDFAKDLKAAAARLGIDPTFIGGHSLRIGAATDAKNAGLTTDQIKALGRWSSDAYLLYTKYTHEDIARLAAHPTRPRAKQLSSADLSTWAARLKLHS